MKCGLVSDIDRLIAEQSADWPLLARGIAGLRASRTRAARVCGHDVLVRNIPHRITSTTAAVDPVSISQRPCFLCRGNLPKEQRGIAMDSEFTAYCNPFPILEKHLTIVHNAHHPQAIAGRAGSLLRLAEALPGYFLIYNGPECGASAPDHLHFQACSRSIFPIEQDTLDVDALSVPNYCRRVLLLRHTDAGNLSSRIEDVIAILADVTARSPEPLINVAAFHDNGRWTVFLFPRSKHRPRVYETGELTVSPATIDLSGVFIVPLPDDFERIDGPAIERIFDEVTLAPQAFNIVLDRIDRMDKSGRLELEK